MACDSGVCLSCISPMLPAGPCRQGSALRSDELAFGFGPDILACDGWGNHEQDG